MTPELPEYKAYFVPHGKQEYQLAEMFAKVMTVFYNEGYQIIETHELDKQGMTIVIFRKRHEDESK